MRNPPFLLRSVVDSGCMLAARMTCTGLRLVALVVFFGSPLSCAGALIDSGGFRVSQKWLDQDLAEVRPLAATLFGCREEQIQFMVLEVSSLQSALPVQIGGSGCGRKSTFAVDRGGRWVPSAVTESRP